MKGKNRPNIVIPTIRSKAFFIEFLNNWSEEFKGCHIIIVEDRKEKQLEEVMYEYSRNVGCTYTIYDWRDIDKDLGDNAWIIPRQTDCVRSYGYLKAYQNKPLFILTLDDDTKPLNKGYIQEHYYNLFLKKNKPEVMSSMMHNEVRGCEVFNTLAIGANISHSGWVGSPDLSARQQVKADINGKYESITHDFYNGFVPKGVFIPMCGMAVAWRPEVTKYMYFGLQGKDTYGIDRCGDIWAGFYAKYNMDKEDKYIHTGKPFVIHDRASNVWHNMYKEEGSQMYGKEFLLFLKGKKHMIMEDPSNDYWNKLENAYRIWGKLLNETK